MRLLNSRTLLALIVAAIGMQVGCGNKDQNAKDQSNNWPPQVSSNEASETTVVATLDTPLNESGNALWCATFQLAWNHACEDVLGEAMEIAGAEAIASRLNNSQVSEQDLPPGTYYAAAGMLDQGIVKTIHDDMADKFPNHRAPLFDDVGDTAMVAYAYLNARVEFAIPYEEGSVSFKDAIGNKHQVKGFRLHEDHDYQLKSKQEKQINVLYQVPEEEYSSRLSEFALDLTADQTDNQLIVAVLPRGESLQSIIRHLNERIATDAPESTVRPSIVRVPNVVTNLLHTFSELEGEDKRIQNAGKLMDYYISKAQQSIKFRLDKSGAVVISEAELAAAGEAELSYNYIVDRPFLVLMKQRDRSLPYFAAWIENVELLETK